MDKIKYDVPSPVPQSTEQDQCCMKACRQSGRAVLRDVIHRLRQKARNLETLANMLPAEPTPEQDEALWHIACNLER